MTKSFWLNLIAGSLVLALATPLAACKVPVFRYALERWASDNYRIVVIIDGDPSSADSTAIERLQAAAQTSLNADVEVIDLSKLTEAELWSVEGIQHTDNLPVLQVFYPESKGTRRMCWSGELTIEHVDSWIESPLRKAIAKDLATGVSATWILAEGTDESVNDALFDQLQRALESASKQIKVPEGVIRREDAAQLMRENPSASMDDILRSDIPLRIEFTIHRLRNDDDDEPALRAMLAGGTDQIQPPFVCPVFGRARIAEPLTASVFSEEAVVSACEYLVGECSCSVKSLSPGIDMLLNTDWQAELGNEIVMVNSQTPTTAATISIPPGQVSKDQVVAASQESSRPLIGISLTLVAVMLLLYAAMRRR